MYRASRHDIIFTIGFICLLGLILFCGFQLQTIWLMVLYLQLWVFWKIYQDRRYLKQTVHLITSLRYAKCEYPLPITPNQIANKLIHEFNLIYAALDREKINANRAQAGIENQVWHRTQDLNRQLKQVSRTASVDDLSGLSNRKYLNLKSHELFDKAVESGTDLCMIMIDVDHFKETNDQWGHQAGDKVIAFIGELLRASTRSSDLCARFGGDEFILVLPDCSAKQGLSLADRIRRMFAREVELYIKDHCRQTICETDILPRLSIGLASLLRDHPLTIEQLKQMADSALYKAKGNGKNRIAVYG